MLPFGLTNAPAVFQALVNDILRDTLNHFVFVYLDILFFLNPGGSTSTMSRLCCTLTPEMAFKNLKTRFTSASILQVPDLNC